MKKVVEAVKEKKKQKEVVLPKIEIVRVYDVPNSNWLKGKRLVCCNCGKKDYPFYELADLRINNKFHKMVFVCSECLFGSNYERRFQRNTWVWRKIGNK